MIVRRRDKKAMKKIDEGKGIEGKEGEKRGRVRNDFKKDERLG